MKPIHDRMPVILLKDAWDYWIDPELNQKSDLADLLHPCKDDFLTKLEIGNYVNNPRNEGPKCIEATGKH